MNSNSRFGSKPSDSNKKQRSKRSSQKTKTAFQEKKPRKWGLWVFLGATAAFVGIAAIYETERQRNPSSPTIDVPAEQSTKSALASKNFPEIKSAFKSINSSRQQPLPVRVENLQEQIELAKRAMKFAEGDEQTEWAQINCIRSMVLLESLSLGQKMPPTKYFNEYRDVVSELRESSIDAVARDATVASLVHQVIEYMRKKDPRNGLEDLKAKFRGVHALYPNDKAMARSIQTTSLMFRPYPEFRETELALIELVSGLYLDSEDPDLKQLGEQLATERIVLTYGLRDAENSFVIDPDSASEKLSEVLNTILANENRFTASTAARLTGACNVFELYGLYDLAIEKTNQLEESVELIPVKEDREMFKLMLESIRTRCRAIGSKLDFDEVAVDGTPIRSADTPDQPIVICFLPGRSELLDKTVDLLKSLQRQLAGEIELVLIVVKGDRKNLEELAKFKNVESQLIIDTELTTKLFKTFPVRIRPSFLLVNRDHVMVKKVIDARELSNQIKQYLIQDQR